MGLIYSQTPHFEGIDTTCDGIQSDNRKFRLRLLGGKESEALYGREKNLSQKPRSWSLLQQLQNLASDDHGYQTCPLVKSFFENRCLNGCNLSFAECRVE